MKKKLFITALIIGSVFAMKSFADKPTGERLFSHVIVIGIDGLSSEGLKQSQTPVMDKLIATGAFKCDARTVLPTVSAPNWGAMIHGAGPEATGISSNAWQTGSKGIQPVVKNQAGRFPSIFNIIREQLPKAEQGVIFQWEGFGKLVQKEIVDCYAICSTPTEATLQFCNYISDKKPVFAFIQLDGVDDAGHQFGHNTPEYLQAVASADSMVGRIMESIQLAGMEDNTLVMIVSDHGGLNKGHGGESVEESTVPVIYYGKAVKKNYLVRQVVYMYDLAANVAFALNLKIPYAWTGRPTLSAFEGYPEQENW